MAYLSPAVVHPWLYQDKPAHRLLEALLLALCGHTDEVLASHGFGYAADAMSGEMTVILERLRIFIGCGTHEMRAAMKRLVRGDVLRQNKVPRGSLILLLGHRRYKISQYTALPTDDYDRSESSPARSIYRTTDRVLIKRIPKLNPREINPVKMSSVLDASAGAMNLSLRTYPMRQTATLLPGPTREAGISQESSMGPVLDAGGFEEIEPPKPRKRGRPASKTPPGNAQPPKRIGRPLKDQPGDAHQLLSYHCENFKKRFGEDYMPNFGRDLKLARLMLKSYRLDRLQELNDAYFRSGDPFYKNGGFQFGLFKVAIPKLVVSTPRAPRKTSEALDLVVGQKRFYGETPTEKVWEEWNGSEWVENRVAKPKVPSKTYYYDMNDLEDA